MTQYQITLSDEIVHGLFKEDGAMAKLVEQVLNQVLEAEVTERLQGKPYERTEERQGLILALMEMVINGVSTRKVAKITEELCGTEFSKSTVSELCKRLDPLVKEWNERPLKEAYPFVMVDRSHSSP